MKKRITRRSHNGDSLLPVTQADALSSKGKKRGRSKRGGGICGPVTSFFTVVALSILFVVGVVLHIKSEGSTRRPMVDKLKGMHDYLHKKVTGQKQRKFTLQKKQAEVHERMQQELENEKVEPHVHANADSDNNDSNQKDLPLYPFESIRFALAHSELVLFYFAASWCPMSTPITEQLDGLFRDILLPLPSFEENAELKGLVKKNHGISLVYVSSDRSQEEMVEYQKENWWSIPYNSPDRENLKRHFKTCAKEEMEGLGMEERDREIPALLVVAGATHEVLTYEGIQDVKDQGQQAVDRWLKLLLDSRGEGGDLQ